MGSFTRRLLGLSGGLLFLAMAPSALAQKVAVYGAPGTTTWNSDVQSKIASTNLFTQVDAYLASNSTPTLAQLLAYDAVFVYSDTSFSNPIAMGDVLADYMDQGRGVVIATFAFNDSGVAVPALALTIAVPIALAASLAHRQDATAHPPRTPA